MFFFIIIKSIKSVKSPASGKKNVRFPDSPDFEKFPDRDVMSGKALPGWSWASSLSAALCSAVVVLLEYELWAVDE